MKFRVRDGFTLFRGQHAHEAAFANLVTPGGYRGRGSHAAGTLVELTGADLAALGAREKGMLEAVDDEARAALQGVEPTAPPATSTQTPEPSGGVYDLYARGQSERPRERIPEHPVGIVWRT